MYFAPDFFSLDCHEAILCTPTGLQGFGSVANGEGIGSSQCCTDSLDSSVEWCLDGLVIVSIFLNVLS